MDIKEISFEEADRCYFDEEIHPKTKTTFKLNYRGWKKLTNERRQLVLKEDYYNKMEKFIDN
jgi:hypothetical protein